MANKLNNILIIAKKEFSDLLSNWMMLVVLCVYFFFAIYIILDFYDILSGMKPGVGLLYGENIGIAAASDIFVMLSKYGVILGIMIGCLSISNERHNSALNVLITKPLFRDTIINGKLIGAIAFLSFVMGLTIAFFTSIFFMLFGGLLAPVFMDYTSRLLIAFIISLIYILIFLMASMLISILIRNQAFAMILSVIILYLSNIFASAIDAMNVASLFPGNEDYVSNLIENLSPTGSWWILSSKLFNTSNGALEALESIIPDTIKLLIFVIILGVGCYIAFMWRDIA